MSELIQGMKAAKYLRMSTEHQQYSLDNQSNYIDTYAKKNQIEIIHTYQDEGKSGLTISGRSALQSLIDDVIKSRIKINAVLVYDVSRFGRFQDIDEAAYYSHQLKSHGVAIIYCAEPMSSEYPELSMLYLNMQRLSAAAFSSNLSEKVFAGQVNLIKRGYRQGGLAGYGLRRQLVDEFDNVKEILEFGKRKSIQTDRIKLIPGPQTEIDWVNRIFDMFLEEQKPERVIASELNRLGIPAENNTQWTRCKVHQILTNEKYIGHNIFGKTSFKLKRKFIKNPESEWVRYNNAYPAIVHVEKFMAAQEIILARSAKLTNSQLLEALKSLLAKKGQLSGFIIDEDEFIPSSSTYRHRFGSLLKAYVLIDYTPNRNYDYIKTNHFVSSYRQTIVNDLIAGVYTVNGWVEPNEESSLFRINGEFDLSIVLSRCYSRPSGRRYWKIKFDRYYNPDITIAVRMDTSNQYPLDYYILPAIDNVYHELMMNDMNPYYLEFYRFPSLVPFFNLVRRSVLMEPI